MSKRKGQKESKGKRDDPRMEIKFHWNFDILSVAGWLDGRQAVQFHSLCTLMENQHKKVHIN